jgi:flagellin-like protein
MGFHRERRGVSEVFGMLLMTAMVVSLGVLIFGFSSGGMSNLGQSYAAAMSNRINAISEKFAIEQVTFTIPTLSLDGSASATAIGASVPASLTTTKANDVIYAVVQVDAGTINTPTATGLTFILRKSVTNGIGGVLSTYYAIASSALSALSITAQATGGAANINLVVFGISGANTGSPFDSNVAVPASATGTGTAATVSISTSNANDFIIGAVGSDTQPPPADTAGTGFTLIQTITQPNTPITASSEYNIVAAKQTNLAVPFTLGAGATTWEMIADAIQAPTPGADVYVRNVGVWPATIVAVYISDLTSNTFVSRTTLSTTLNARTFVDIPNTTLTFTPSHGHTYSFTVTSSLGSSKIYSLKVT